MKRLIAILFFIFLTGCAYKSDNYHLASVRSDVNRCPINSNDCTLEGEALTLSLTLKTSDNKIIISGKARPFVSGSSVRLYNSQAKLVLLDEQSNIVCNPTTLFFFGDLRAKP